MKQLEKERGWFVVVVRQPQPVKRFIDETKRGGVCEVRRKRKQAFRASLNLS
jgi:hypothetical protein